MMMILRCGLVMLFRMILNSRDPPASASQTHNCLNPQFQHIQYPLLASVCSAFMWCTDIHGGKHPCVYSKMDVPISTSPHDLLPASPPRTGQPEARGRRFILCGVRAERQQLEMPCFTAVNHTQIINISKGVKYSK